MINCQLFKHVVNLIIAIFAQINDTNFYIDSILYYQKIKFNFIFAFYSGLSSIIK